MPVGPILRDDESAEFFDATADRKLLVQHCAVCGHKQYPLPFAPSVRRCRACASRNLSWEPAAGTGTLVSWTHIHGKPGKDGSPAPVTTVGIVELDEGPWVHTQLRVAPDHALRVGDALQVDFDRAEGGEAVAVFVPAGS
jgi:uncharacterized OB-fold protein